MNTFNRIVLIVLCVLVVIAAISIITMTWTIPNRSVNWLQDAAQWVDDNDGDLEKALLTTVSAFAGLVAVIVLLIELIPRRGPAVQVTDLASGSATLSVAAISQRIEEAVVKVPHVAEVRANVKSRRKGVIVSLDLQVDPDANLATVTDEACQVAGEVLTERVHVHLLRPPSARLHYRELRLHRGNGNDAGSTRRFPIAPPERQLATEPAGGFAESRGSVALAEPPAPPDLPENLRRGDEPALADDNEPEEKPT